MSGDSIIYLYPDLHTALVGKWDNDSMKRAKLTKVVGLTQKDGYPYPVLAEPLDNDCVTYCNDLSGITEISSSPLLCDPYETMHVQCLVSTLNGGGEGLFAARDLAPGTVVSFYNGVRFHDCHVSYTRINFAICIMKNPTND